MTLVGGGRHEDWGNRSPGTYAKTEWDILPMPFRRWTFWR